MIQNLFILVFFAAFTAGGMTVQFGPSLLNIVMGVIVAAVVAGDMQWRRE